MRRDLENQMRGIARTFGVAVGKGSGAALAGRVRRLVADDGPLAAIMKPLLVVHGTVLTELVGLDAAVLDAARGDDRCRRLMTAPSVGPITALTFVAMIDDVTRFGSSSDVGAYLGLTPRRHQSGEIDRGGRISKCGDTTLRALLYDAAHVLLSRAKRDSELRSWGAGAQAPYRRQEGQGRGGAKACVVLHTMWANVTTFEAAPGSAAR